MTKYWNWKMCKFSNYRPLWLVLVISLILVNSGKCNSFGLEGQGQLQQFSNQHVPSPTEGSSAQEESGNYYHKLPGSQAAQPLPLPLPGGAAAMLQSDEDPINHSLEQFPSSTENSIGVSSDYTSNQMPGYQVTDYNNANQLPAYQATETDYNTNQMPAFQSSSPGSVITSDGSISTTTESAAGLMGDPGQLPVSQPRLGTIYAGDDGYPVDPALVGSNQAASDRILVRHSIRKKVKLPVYTTVFSHHRVIPDRPPRHPRYKRRPRRGKPRPRRQRGRGRGRGRRPHSRGGPPPPQQPYGVGSMQLPTYAPAFVSYGPIYGPPPGIQIKHPVHNQGYGLPTQQSMAYLPVVPHGPNGMMASSNNNYGYPPPQQQPPYLPPPGNSMPPHPPNDHYRRPALTISVEAPSNMYASEPQNIDGTPVVRVKPPGNMYMGHNSQPPPPAGPHPVPGFDVPIPLPSSYGPPRGPMGPLPATGPSYLAPMQVQSAQPPRYAQPLRQHPPYGQPPPGNYYQATNQYGYSAPPPSSYNPSKNNYNPPMHYGSPMHNFGPPMSSLGQPPPIMDDPMIDKWAPPTGYHSYPGGAGYSSHEHAAYTNNDQPTRYPPNQGYRNDNKNNYYKNKNNNNNKDSRGKYHDFHASAEDHYGHSDETSTSSYGNPPPPRSGSYGSSSSTSGYGSPNPISDHGNSRPNSGDYGSSSSTPGYYGSDAPPSDYSSGSRKPRNKQRKPSYDDMPPFDREPSYNGNSGSNNGFPEDEFFDGSSFQSDSPNGDRIPSPRRPWRRRRTGSGNSYYKGGNYENYVNPNDRKGEEYDYNGNTKLKTPQSQGSSFESVDVTRPVRNRGSGYGKDYSTVSPTRSSSDDTSYDSSPRSEGSSGSKYVRPVPKYDTEYNSPGMSKDQKVTDWFDYAERTRNQKLKLGYPRNHKKKVVRYRTLPDSVDNYSADPNHRKYPKLTYDSLIKRIVPDDKGPNFLTEETKVKVFKTGSEFKKMLNDHDKMRI